MKHISRRSILKTAAGAAAALSASPQIATSLAKITDETPGCFFEKEFGISDQLCRKVLSAALAKGGDYADIFFEHTVNNYLVLEDGKVNRSSCEISLGVGIRTICGDQVGYGFTQELSEKSMLSAATTAASIADSSPNKPAGKFISMEISDFYPLKTLMTNVPLEDKLKIVQELNTQIFQRSPLITKAQISLSENHKQILIINSLGTKTSDQQPLSHLSASIVAEKDGKQEQERYYLGGRCGFEYYNQETINTIADEAVKRVLTLFDATIPPAGEIPVVVGPDSGVLLHEAIGHGMEADFNRKGTSTYATMLNQKVAQSDVTIVDDGTNLNLAGSINVDDEGTPGQCTVLVEKGILRGYLHDRISAKHYGVSPTGNGRRESFEHYVVPRMRNTYMMSGSDNEEDIIRSVKNGIYVKSVSNGQVKIGEGDFAFYVSQGNLIEDGKLTAPIKDVNIMGNGPKMLRNITRVADNLAFSRSAIGRCGKDGQSVPVGFGMPTVLVKSLTVGGRKS